ncbi:hypothetical protein J537_1000 [Acinetobacter baumannii 1437282]|nr:hypothetical protein J537_1000 [Acinetobacter baumannii 1437282]
MKKLLLTLLLSPLPSITFGSEWLHLFNTEAEAYYLDLESLKPVNRFNKDLSKGWVKIEIIKDIEKDGMTVGDYGLTLWNFDCDTNKLGLVQAIRYKNGKSLGTSFNISVPTMRDAIPDTVGEDLLSRACSISKIQNSKENL